MKTKKEYIAEFISGGRVVSTLYSAKRIKGKVWGAIEPRTGMVVERYYREKGNKSHVVRFYAKPMIEEYLEYINRPKTPFGRLARSLKRAIEKRKYRKVPYYGVLGTTRLEGQQEFRKKV